MRETGIEEGRGEGKGERSIFESSGTGMKTKSFGQRRWIWAGEALR